MPLSSFVEIESYIKNHARFTLFQLTSNAPWLAIVPFNMLVGRISFSLAISKVSDLLR